jgi:hypothetical protein
MMMEAGGGGTALPAESGTVRADLSDPLGDMLTDLPTTSSFHGSPFPPEASTRGSDFHQFHELPQDDDDDLQDADGLEKTHHGFKVEGGAFGGGPPGGGGGCGQWWAEVPMRLAARGDAAKLERWQGRWRAFQVRASESELGVVANLAWPTVVSNLINFMLSFINLLFVVCYVLCCTLFCIFFIIIIERKLSAQCCVHHDTTARPHHRATWATARWSSRRRRWPSPSPT